MGDGKGINYHQHSLALGYGRGKFDDGPRENAWEGGIDRVRMSERITMYHLATLAPGLGRPGIRETHS
jgi:hypothetical protein